MVNQVGWLCQLQGFLTSCWLTTKELGFVIALLFCLSIKIMKYHNNALKNLCGFRFESDDYWPMINVH